MPGHVRSRAGRDGGNIGRLPAVPHRLENCLIPNWDARCDVTTLPPLRTFLPGWDCCALACALPVLMAPSAA